jgi:hypothetical protein
MGVDLYISKNEYLCGGLSNDDVDFITDHLREYDDGCYAIINDDLAELEKELSNEEKEKFGFLMDALYRGLAKENGFLVVRIR